MDSDKKDAVSSSVPTGAIADRSRSEKGLPPASIPSPPVQRQDPVQSRLRSPELPKAAAPPGRDRPVKLRWTPEQRLRVLVAGDHTVFRQGLRALLAARPEIDLVIDTPCGDLGTVALRGAGCHLALLDLWTNSEARRLLPTLAARLPVLAIATKEDESEIQKLVRLGARGIVGRTCTVETLVEACKRVAGGGTWLPPHWHAHVAPVSGQDALSPLTQREREVVRHVASGLRNAETAAALFVSEVTVKTHLNNVFRKLGVRDRVALALYAARAGIVDVDGFRPAGRVAPAVSF